MPSSIQSLCYEDLLNAGVLSSESDCCLYLIGKKILPTNWNCLSCGIVMPCSSSIYSDGFCWRCPCGSSVSVRKHSILERSPMPFRKFTGASPAEAVAVDTGRTGLYLHYSPAGEAVPVGREDLLSDEVEAAVRFRNLRRELQC